MEITKGVPHTDTATNEEANQEGVMHEGHGSTIVIQSTGKKGPRSQQRI